MKVFDSITTLPIINENVIGIRYHYNKDPEFFKFKTDEIGDIPLDLEKELKNNFEYTYLYFREYTLDNFVTAVSIYEKENDMVNALNSPEKIIYAYKCMRLYFMGAVSEKSIDEKALFYHDMVNRVHMNHLKLIKEQFKTMKENGTFENYLKYWSHK